MYLDVSLLVLFFQSHRKTRPYTQSRKRDQICRSCAMNERFGGISLPHQQPSGEDPPWAGRIRDAWPRAVATRDQEWTMPQASKAICNGFCLARKVPGRSIALSRTHKWLIGPSKRRTLGTDRASERMLGNTSCLRISHQEALVLASLADS